MANDSHSTADKMKNIILFSVLLLTFSCGKSSVEKPDNLIDEDKMVDVLYDLAVLEALRSQKSMELAQNGVDHTTYIFEKHKIDSVQLASSNRYYASDLEKYKEIYDQVKERIEERKLQLDAKSGDKPKKELDDTPQVQ